jgi:hypothetical protein
MIIQQSSDQDISNDKGNANFEPGLLMHYGTCIAQYHGHGELTLKGDKKLGCKFVAGQLNNGEVIMLCDFSPSIQFMSDLSESSFKGNHRRVIR